MKFDVKKLKGNIKTLTNGRNIQTKPSNVTPKTQVLVLNRNNSRVLLSSNTNSPNSLPTPQLDVIDDDDYNGYLQRKLIRKDGLHGIKATIKMKRTVGGEGVNRNLLESRGNSKTNSKIDAFKNFGVSVTNLFKPIVRIPNHLFLLFLNLLI